MNAERELRDVHIAQLVKLLAVAQDVARKLAEGSHGRSHEQVGELNEIIHLARVQINAIQTEAASNAWYAVERRRTPRSRFGGLS